MYSLKPDPVIADCWTDVNALCSGIVFVANTILRCPFYLDKQQYYFLLKVGAEGRAGLVWKVNISCHSSLSKHVKGSLIWVLVLLAPSWMSRCASRCACWISGGGVLTWNLKRHINFFSVCLELKKEQESRKCFLPLFLVPAVLREGACPPIRACRFLQLMNY